MRRVSVLGSTGSIGCNTVALIAAERDAYDVVALTGGRNIARLADQAKALRPEIVVTAHDDCLADLRTALVGSGLTAAAGRQAICEAASIEADWVMSAIVGAAGLEPGLRVLARGGTLALANKETLVCAGPLVLATARASGAQLLPVDSEHSGIFQALADQDIATVERILITASGGAFRDWPLADLACATPEQAATHPNWAMGRRITIDSASMFNKALELIETREYFAIDPARIEVLLHPESLVHALVGYADGALIAHLGPPDMRHAIGYALHWPERRALPVERLDLARIGGLSFATPDEQRWPALRLSREVMAVGGLAGAIFNGAKEAALDGFLARAVNFPGMAGVVEEVLTIMSADGSMKDAVTLDTVLAADQMARERASEVIAGRASQDR